MAIYTSIILDSLGSLAKISNPAFLIRYFTLLITTVCANTIRDMCLISHSLFSIVHCLRIPFAQSLLTHIKNEFEMHSILFSLLISPF